MKRFLSLCLLLAVLAAGCSPEWKKKFIRKRKKDAPGPQAVLVLQPDHKALFPPAHRYREHYAFWKSWHGELLASLGQIRKRDLRYLDGVVSEVRSMQALLSGPSADRLREIGIELSNLQESWENSPVSWAPPVSHRVKLERLQREIAKDFQYADVKDSIAPDPQLAGPDPTDG